MLESYIKISPGKIIFFKKKQKKSLTWCTTAELKRKSRNAIDSISFISVHDMQQQDITRVIQVLFPAKPNVKM